jgi:hypothetical protein
MMIEITVTISNCMEVRFAGPAHEPQAMSRLDNNRILIKINKNNLSDLIEAEMRFTVENSDGLCGAGVIAGIQRMNGFVFLTCRMETELIPILKEV